MDVQLKVKLAEGWCEMAFKAMGLIPAALSGQFGKENRGFGLGLLPGLLYKDRYKDKEEEKEEERKAQRQAATQGMKKGGMVGSASKRADGCAQRGKTRGKMV
jgi:hypothetical protein